MPAFFYALCEFVPFQNARHSELPGKFEYVFKIEFGKPLTVVSDFRFFNIENSSYLFHIALGIFLHFFP